MAIFIGDHFTWWNGSIGQTFKLIGAYQVYDAFAGIIQFFSEWSANENGCFGNTKFNGAGISFMEIFQEGFILFFGKSGVELLA